MKNAQTLKCDSTRNCDFSIISGLRKKANKNQKKSESKIEIDVFQQENEICRFVL